MDGGSRRSRDIARKIRAWLRKVMSSTLVIPARAPVEIRADAQFSAGLLSTLALRLKAEAIAALVSMSGYRSMPVITPDTARYKKVQITSEAMMPMGTSRWGFLASSEWAEIESKPMKAKKTMDAPSISPEIPKGKKFVRVLS